MEHSSTHGRKPRRNQQGGFTMNTTYELWETWLTPLNHVAQERQETFTSKRAAMDEFRKRARYYEPHGRTELCLYEEPGTIMLESTHAEVSPMR